MHGLSPWLDVWVLSVWLVPLVAGLVGLVLARRDPNAGTGWFLAAMSWVAVGSLALMYHFWANGAQPAYGLSTQWLNLTGGPQLTMGLHADATAALLLAIVGVVALLVAVFSVGYMAGEKRLPQYWAYLGLFVSAMNTVVLADHLVLLFIGWEGVGAASYLLIGFWHTTPKAASGSLWAFSLNRVGDVLLLLGVVGLLAFSSTGQLDELTSLMQSSLLTTDGWQLALATDAQYELRGLPSGWLTSIGLLLLGGVAAKSAQVPFFVWLPRAMAGPTPISALLHAATMVAAGVYVLARIYPLLTPDALTVMAYMGAATALIGAFLAMRQWDIKTVLAYSTVSQLGYMVMGMGTYAYPDALFHLTTHAFFKAGLFLGAGAIIHLMQQHLPESHPKAQAQDMRHMGGLFNRNRLLGVAYVMLAASLVGVPLFSGFLSKEGLLAGAWGWANMTGDLAYLVPVAAFLAAGLTAYYMLRQVLLVFAGEPRLALPGRLALPASFKWPIVGLALLSLGLVYSLNPLSPAASPLREGLIRPQLLTPVPAGQPSHYLQVEAVDAATQSLELYALGGAMGMLLLGVGAGWWHYRRNQFGVLHPEERPLTSWVSGVWKMSACLTLLSGTALAWFDRQVLDRLVHLTADAAGTNGAAQAPSRSASPKQRRGSLAQRAFRWEAGIWDGLLKRSANLLGQTGSSGSFSLAHAMQRFDAQVMDAPADAASAHVAEPPALDMVSGQVGHPNRAWSLAGLATWLDAQVVDAAVRSFVHAIRGTGRAWRALQAGRLQGRLLLALGLVVALMLVLVLL